MNKTSSINHGNRLSISHRCRLRPNDSLNPCNLICIISRARNNCIIQSIGYSRLIEYRKANYFIECSLQCDNIAGISTNDRYLEDSFYD